MVKSIKIKEELSEFQFDIKRWKSLITHMENEAVFIHRLLNSDVFDTITTSTISERLNLFKKQIKAKTDVLRDFKVEVNDHQGKLAGILEENKILSETIYKERHNSIKNRFEKFNKDFNNLKIKVLRHTGSIL